MNNEIAPTSDNIKIAELLESIFWTLNTISDYWGNDTQELFAKFMEVGNEWDIPSLDESAWQFLALAQFINGTPRA